MGKGRSNQRAIVFKHTAKLDKGFLRVRHNVQCIGDNDNIKGLVSIRQMEHILHGKYSLEEKSPRFACAIIAAETSVASMWSAEHRRCFATCPVPVATSKTVLCHTAGRSSAYN